MRSKGLKALDIIANYQVIIDHEKDETSTIQEQLPNSCNIIEKELKALKIIKEKNVDVGLLKGLINGNPKTALEDYNDTTDEEELTIVEYELLKKVLL